MKQMDRLISLDHGEGGAATNRLVTNIFLKHLGTPKVLEDAAVLTGSPKIAMTTDSFVVKPIVFPGGDLGKLAICGTINDLAVMGAIPKYITAGFILEEGTETALLEKIVESMGETAHSAGVSIVSGDTKVVGRGEADKIFINTSGVGFINDNVRLSAANCRDGDAILVSGGIGEHGIAVIVSRENFGITGDLRSDCAPLNSLTYELLTAVPEIRCMRDLTRGGLATNLVEISEASQVGMRILETSVPVRKPVRSACDLLGLDPLYTACEGRLLAVVPKEFAAKALSTLRSHPDGQGASLIGNVVSGRIGVTLETVAGGTRPLIRLEGVQLPRIC